jgi:hypothetical protein
VGFAKVDNATIQLILSGGHPSDIQDLNKNYLPILENAEK